MAIALVLWSHSILDVGLGLSFAALGSVPGAVLGTVWLPLRRCGLQGDASPSRTAMAASTEAMVKRAEKMAEDVESELYDATFRLSSNIFGFPDFRSLVDLRSDGTAHFYAGMIAKEDGRWSVVNGDEEEGERLDDLYLQFTHPLPERYVSIFNVPGGTCFWRGRLDIKVGATKGKAKVVVSKGFVVSEVDGGTALVREGTFSALVVTQKEADAVRLKSREAFERALTAPRGESTGFKTPARIAGMEKGQRKLLAAGEERKMQARALTAAQDPEEKKKTKEEKAKERKDMLDDDGLVSDTPDL